VIQAFVGVAPAIVNLARRQAERRELYARCITNGLSIANVKSPNNTMACLLISLRKTRDVLPRGVEHEPRSRAW
jgi:hypothetical protein